MEHIKPNSLCFVGCENEVEKSKMSSLALQFVEARRVKVFLFFNGFCNNAWFAVVSKIRKTHKNIVRIFVDCQKERSADWLEKFLFKKFEARVVAADIANQFLSNNSQQIEKKALKKMLNFGDEQPKSSIDGKVFCAQAAILNSTYCLFSSKSVLPQLIELANILHKEVVFVNN